MPTEILFNAPRRTALLALAALGLGGTWQAHAAEAMAYRYWDWGKTHRDDYQVAALTLALEKTAPTYGPFSVTRVLDNMSTSRVRREVRTGHRLNIHVGPWRDVEAGPLDERSFLIDTPILGGLLGYRRLLVRQDELAQFQAITNEGQLKQRKAGLGRGWEDVAVLRHNGYLVEDSGNMRTLLDMLVNRRFDYLPISVTEAGALLEQHPQQARKLVLVPNLVLYYPLPAVFYVSAAQPKLARRVEQGLATAKRDGSLDELTARYFQQEIKQLKASGKRCFMLSNPMLPRSYAAAPTILNPGKASAANAAL